MKTLDQHISAKEYQEYARTGILPESNRSNIATSTVENYEHEFAELETISKSLGNQTGLKSNARGLKKDLSSEKESVYQARVSNIFRNAGWLGYHTHDSRRSEPGFPDNIWIRDDRIVVAELKTKRRNLTPEQYMWLLAFVATGKVEVYVWYAERSEDWAEIERVSK